MSERERQQHPSGRPIRCPKRGIRSIWRIPDDGYVTPRLREKPLRDAIGFHRFEIKDDDE